MRLILFDLDGPQRRNFWPLALSRPLWELRSGMTTLAEKIVRKVGASDVARDAVLRRDRHRHVALAVGRQEARDAIRRLDGEREREGR